MPTKANKWFLDFQAFFKLQGNNILKWCMLLATVGIITAFLPHKIAFQYEYAINKPWIYKDLIAPFDFNIYKGDLQLEAEQKKALEKHKPYYRKSEDTPEEVVQVLTRQLGKQLEPEILVQLTYYMQQRYAQGVLEDGPKSPDGTIFLRMNKDAKAMVFKQDDFLSQSTYLAGWYTLLSSMPLRTGLADSLRLFGSKHLEPNLAYDANFTDKKRDELLEKVSQTTGKVQQGELIINKGSLVYEDTYRKINSLEREIGAYSYQGWQRWWSLLGQALLVAMIMGLLVAYLIFFRPALFDDTRRLAVILLNMVFVVALFSLATRKAIPSVYLIPFCVLPILTRALFDGWLAMMVTLVATLLTSFFSGYASEFMVLQLAAGMASVFTLISIRNRSQFYLSSGIVFLVYALGYTAYTLVNKGDFRELIPLYYGYFGVNAILTLIASPLLFGYEKVFGFVSDVSLMELSDTNNPLLRRLSLEAPGTFQHTLQVANLAEAAIYEIGGNALLVRVGALYHDIGKLTNPVYFIENQHASLNPHDDLPFEESAQIIIGHVLDGITLAKKHRLPEVVVDFIRTHHGDQRVEYFYQSHLRNFPDLEVDEGKFRYPGPKPFSKETAVLMMADSVEAASRSLKNPNAQSISDLVETIINKQLQNEQYLNADITLRDIGRIKKLFKKMLNSIYHVRIEYPGQLQR